MPAAEPSPVFGGRNDGPAPVFGGSMTGAYGAANDGIGVACAWGGQSTLIDSGRACTSPLARLSATTVMVAVPLPVAGAWNFDSTRPLGPVATVRGFIVPIVDENVTFWPLATGRPAPSR